MQLEAEYADEPEHDEVIALCVRAWNELGTCRYIGMAAGAIPWDVIVDWAEFEQLGRELTVMLIHVIRTLDNDRAEAAAAKARLAAAGRPG